MNLQIIDLWKDACKFADWAKINCADCRYHPDRAGAIGQEAPCPVPREALLLVMNKIRFPQHILNVVKPTETSNPAVLQIKHNCPSRKSNRGRPPNMNN